MSGKCSSGDQELETALREAGLQNWLDVFRHDLGVLWDRRGHWKSQDEFLAINRHVERLLWQAGVFPWKTEGGEIRIEVPLATDAARLAEFQARCAPNDPLGPTK
jgi:hypothetical protein